MRKAVRTSDNAGGMAAANRKNKTKILTPFGKLWQPGDRIRVFYPTMPVFPDNVTDEEIASGEVEPDSFEIMAVTDFGYSIAPKLIKGLGIFCKSLSEVDEYRRPVTMDVLYVASKIIRVIHEAEKQKEIAEIAVEYKDEPTQQAVRLKEVEDLYSNATLAISNLQQPICTECVVVRMMPMAQYNPETKQTDTVIRPVVDDPAKTNIAQQTLSATRVELLYDMVNQARFQYHKDLGILEVEYNFPVKDKKEVAGQKEPEGIIMEDSILTKFPDVAPKVIALINQLPKDLDLMYNRQRNFMTQDEAKVRACIATYFRRAVRGLNNLISDDDKNTLAVNYNFFQEFRLPIRDEDLKSAVEELVEKERAKKLKHEAEEAALKSEDEEILEKPPTLEDIQNDKFKDEVDTAKERSTDSHLDDEDVEERFDDSFVTDDAV